jgi:hypothetical protein
VAALWQRESKPVEIFVLNRRELFRLRLRLLRARQRGRYGGGRRDCGNAHPQVRRRWLRAVDRNVEPPRVYKRCVGLRDSVHTVQVRPEQLRHSEERDARQEIQSNLRD